MFEVLTAAFGNANEKQENKVKYRSLRQGTQDFSAFWAEFQRLSQELDHLNEILIDNLIEKCNYSIKKQLTNREQHLTDFLALVKHCQQIKQQLKSADCTKFVQDKTIERDATKKNNRLRFSNKTIVNLPSISTVSLQANSNLNSRIAQIF